MDTVYAIVGLTCALLTAYAIKNRINIDHFKNRRHANLNGLIGFSSLLVFFCHAATWQQYIEDGRWRASDSPSLIIPGQTGIVLFFMITGFLFAKKYLESKNQKIDWAKEYLLKILSLYPAYLFSMCILFGIIYATSFQEKIELTPYVKWILFTIPGAPLLNGNPETNIMMAGTTWPLTFVWAFYFSLPLIATILGAKKSWPAIIFGTTMLVATLYFIPFYGLVYLMLFIGTMAAAIDKYTNLKAILNEKIFGLIALLLLISNGFFNNETAYNATSIAIIGLSFLIFSTGNSIFGVLTKKPMQILGASAYSIYLLHGPLLYIFIKIIQNSNYEIYKSNEGFWLIIIALTPALVLTSVFSYVFIEAPAMKYQEKIIKLIRKIISFKPSAKPL